MTHVNLMIRRRVNTDPPPLKSGEHKTNNIERATNLNLRINNLHVIYMILHDAATIQWMMIINTTGVKRLGGFSYW
jgi:hypothetical protein